MDIHLRVKPELKVLVRIKVLHEVVHELMKGFGVFDSNTMQTIEKGILIKQIIESIDIYYINSNGKAVGKVTLTIDWSQHQILSMSDSGKSFNIDTNKTIKEQISHMYALLVEHSEDLKKNYDVQRTDVHLFFKQEIRTNAQKYNEAQQFLNTHEINNLPEWAETLPPDIEIKYASHKLPELKIKIEHNKPNQGR